MRHSTVILLSATTPKHHPRSLQAKHHPYIKAFFAKDAAPRITHSLVRELADDGIPVAVTCGILGFSRQAYYAWLADPVSNRNWVDAHTINALLTAHADDPEFGDRLLIDKLGELDNLAGENGEQRRYREHGIWSSTVKKGRADSKGRPGPAVHDDLAQRQRDAPKLDTLALNDITEHPTAEGKLSLAPSRTPTPTRSSTGPSTAG